jgi:prepilin signal peptidase PulO-like enzyme (type II secretory pathway)
MQFAIGIITHTPLWAWVLLAYLVWQGLQATQPRSTSIWRLMIVPAVFIAMGLSRIALRPGDGTWPLLAWLLGALVFAPLGLSTRPKLLAVDRENMRVTRAGSKTPLIRNIVVFLLQYAVAVTSALDPHSNAALVGRAISGASAGYFIGWIISLLRQYRNSPKTVEEAPSKDV